jgi:hypothetical protein
VKAFVGVTDNDWFNFLAGLPGTDEVNFWQPSGGGPSKPSNPGILSCSNCMPQTTTLLGADSLLIIASFLSASPGMLLVKKMVPHLYSRCGKELKNIVGISPRQRIIRSDAFS